MYAHECIAKLFYCFSFWCTAIHGIIVSWYSLINSNFTGHEKQCTHENFYHTAKPALANDDQPETKWSYILNRIERLNFHICDKFCEWEVSGFL